MPVLIPLAASAAAYFGAGAVVTGLALTGLTATLVGVVAGAVVGAAVGALGAAVTGGDIGKGALFGALGGAVAGGFAGWNAGVTASAAEGTSSNLINAKHASDSTLLANAEKGLSVKQKAGGGLFGGGKVGLGKATLIGSGLETVGSAASGWAQGEAQKDINKENLEAKDKEFDQRLKEIQEQHSARMGEIGAQNDGAMAVAGIQADSAMNQLNTRIAADKDTVATASKREDDKIKGFNDSVVGVNNNLFNRPDLDLSGDESFSSGFDDAVAKGQQQQKAPLTPKQIQDLKKQQATA